MGVHPGETGWGQDGANRLWSQEPGPLDTGAGFRNQGLADFWSIQFGGINQGDPQIQCTLQNGDRRIFIRWWPPDSIASEAHGTKAEPRDGQVTTNYKGTACSYGSLVDLFHETSFSFSKPSFIEKQGEKQERQPGTRVSPQMAYLTGCITPCLCSSIKVYTLERALSQGGVDTFFLPSQPREGCAFSLD